MSDPFPPDASGASEPTESDPAGHASTVGHAPDFASPAYTPPTPAYAAPPLGDEAFDELAPAPEPTAHAYATPAYAAPAYAGSAYAAPVGGSAPRTYYLPPDARHPVDSPLPVGIVSGGDAVLPPAYRSPSAPVSAEAPRSRVLPGVALGLGIFGALTALVGGGGFSSFLLFMAFVLAIISLASRRFRKGMAVAALILSLLAGLPGLVFGLAGFGGASSPDPSYETYDDIDGGAYTGESASDTAAPGTDGIPDAGAVFAEPVPATVTETTFGHDAGEYWWYAVVIDNPNSDFRFDADIEIHALAADGSTTATDLTYATLLSGETVIVGLLEVEHGDITSLTVELPPASFATVSPAAETGAFTTADVTATAAGSLTTVTGTVSGFFAEDQPFVDVSIIVRAAEGTIVAATPGYADNVPAGGAPVPFEALLDEIPPGATVHAYAHR